MLRFFPNLALEELQNYYKLSSGDFGIYTSAYYIGYATMHIPSGLLISKIQPRFFLTICISVAALGFLPLLFSYSWTACIIGRFFMGIGTSSATVATIYIFRILFPSNFSTLLGVTVASSLLITAFLNILLASEINNIGFSNLLIIFTATGFLLAVLYYFYIPTINTGNISTSSLNSLTRTFTDYRLLFFSFCTALMGGIYTGYADSWGIPFLLVVHNVDKIFAEQLMGTLLVGMCIGSLILPYLANLYNAHIKISIISGIIMTCVFTYFLLYHDIAPKLLTFLSLIIGLFSAQQVVMVSKISSSVPYQHSGLAGSIANFIIMTFGVFFHATIGILLDLNWNGNFSPNGLKTYDTNCFCTSMFIIPVSIVIALIMLILYLMLGLNYRSGTNRPSNG